MTVSSGANFCAFASCVLYVAAVATTAGGIFAAVLVTAGGMAAAVASTDGGTFRASATTAGCCCAKASWGAYLAA